MTWSSSQQLDKKAQVSLLKDLLALSIKLENDLLNRTGIMTNITLKDMTQITTMKSTLENILINLEKKLQVR